jgi:hypothetical protein
VGVASDVQSEETNSYIPFVPILFPPILCEWENYKIALQYLPLFLYLFFYFLRTSCISTINNTAPRCKRKNSRQARPQRENLGEISSKIIIPQIIQGVCRSVKKGIKEKIEDQKSRKSKIIEKQKCTIIESTPTKNVYPVFTIRPQNSKTTSHFLRYISYRRPLNSIKFPHLC